MNDELDVELRDEAAWDEIDLMTDLMIATSQIPGQLTQREVDQILGVEPD